MNRESSSLLRIGLLAVSIGVFGGCGGAGGDSHEFADASSLTTDQRIERDPPAHPAPVTTPAPAPAPTPTPTPDPNPTPTDPPGETSPGMPVSGDPVRGTMGPLFDWPLVPLHAALTPDGRLMSFGRDDTSAAEMVYDVWNWREGSDPLAHLTLPNRTGTDLFCSNQLLLTSGEMLMTGGDRRIDGGANTVGWQTNMGNSDANIFDSTTNTVTRRAQMNEPRWYATATMLPWGEVFIQGGAIDVDADTGAQYPEVASDDASVFRSLVNAPVNDLPWYYPRNFVSRSGDIIGWSHNHAYRIDPRGDGSRTDFGMAPQVELNNGSVAVMFRPNRILLGGGGTPKMILADISGAFPSYDEVPAMSSPRLWGTATVLADGKVLVSNGGTSDTSLAGAGLGEPALHTEIYDPQSNTWTRGAASAVPRLYHSTAILLPDATVLLGGGGLPGPVTNLNAEVFYPPYLFNADGSPATRPVIESLPTVLNPAGTFEIETPDAAGISRVALVKTGAVTHSFDMDQRFIELAFEAGVNLLQVSLPEATGDTPPGFYHVFILNGEGVPSVSSIVRMNVLDAQLPSTPMLGEATGMIGGDQGYRRELACRHGEILAGVHGRAYEHLVQAGPVCVEVDQDGGWSSQPVPRAMSGDPFGNTTIGRFELICPADQAVSGFLGAPSADGQRVGALGLSCRALLGKQTVVGSPTVTDVVGTATVESAIDCTASRAAVGITGKTSINGYFSMGLRCSP